MKNILVLTLAALMLAAAPTRRVLAIRKAYGELKGGVEAAK